MAAIVSSDPEASNGFFSAIGSVLTGFAEGIGQGAKFAGQEILPRFFSQEILNQQFDQLRNPTFIPIFAPNRVDQAQPKPAGLLFDNLNITTGGLLLASAAAIALVLLLRK